MCKEYKKFKESFLKLVSGIPIWGSLVKYSPETRREAYFELFITVLFSTMPIWIGAIIKTFEFASSLENITIKCFASHFLTEFKQNISSGELLVYILAITGPTVYLLLVNKKNKIEIPFKGFRLYALLSFVLGLLSAVMYFHSKDVGYMGDPLFVKASSAMYLFTLFLLIPFFAYKHRDMVPPPSFDDKDASDYQKGYRQHRQAMGAK